MKDAGLKIPAVLLLSVLLAYGTSFGAKHLERTFRVDPGGTLSLHSDFGGVEVAGREGNTVRVVVDSDRDIEEILDLTFTRDGDNITVRGEKKRQDFFSFFWSRGKKVKFTVTVPRVYNVEIKTGGGGIGLHSLEGEVCGKTSGGGIDAGEITGRLEVHTSGGSLDLSGINGPVSASTSGGSIDLGDISGPVEARTSGGHVHAARITGNTVLRTSGGSIKVEELKGFLEARTSGGGIVISALRGNTVARTSGGSIKVSLDEPPAGDCELHTSAGSVTITLPRETNAYVSARTSAGSVRTEFPIEVVGEIKKTHIEGTLGSGGPKIDLSTSAGSIHLKAAD
ncbi:MAG: DUF4097 family beta strand repeat protein [Candidatus Glassbacteria bacterium]|nr:DUF4097 family beta strand repeat protein [Candidatus Glassbacteria bacterium]